MFMTSGNGTFLLNKAAAFLMERTVSVSSRTGNFLAVAGFSSFIWCINSVDLWSRVWIFFFHSCR